MKTQIHLRPHGFTLAEILIVLTIIGILAGSAIFIMKGFVPEAQAQRVEDDIKHIKMAIDAYSRSNYFKPPTEEQGLKALVEEPTSDPKPKRWHAYMEKMPVDPWGNEYQYRVPAKRSKDKFDLFSKGEDGEENDNDIGNWE